MSFESHLGERLPDEALARSRQLPLKPAPVELAGGHVRLAPLDLDRDVERLYAISNGQPCRLGDRAIDVYDADVLVWRYMFAGPFDSADGLRAWLQTQVASPNGLALCVFDIATNSPIGVTNYTSNAPEHLKIELGSIWYSPLVQRTAANTEATYLMLRHAFALGYRRLEWKCDTLNVRSQQAAKRMGFTFEGIQESHYIIKGRNRDTAWFRILDREWPEVRASLEAMLDSEVG
jgi:RimJ/RimL family protein N-acetyltransferase